MPGSACHAVHEKPIDLIHRRRIAGYEAAILAAYGEAMTPLRTGKPGRPQAPYQAAPKGLTYAVVEKTRTKKRVVKVATRVVFGTMVAVPLALGMSKLSRAVNAASVGRENATDRQGALPEASSAALASMLLGRQTSPTQTPQRAERLLRVQEALNSLDPIDREVLALRHFEQLGRAEAAQVLGITQEAGAKRDFRALKSLKDALATIPGGWEGL